MEQKTDSKNKKFIRKQTKSKEKENNNNNYTLIRIFMDNKNNTSDKRKLNKNNLRKSFIQSTVNNIFI